jgi:hypothetical protein
MSSGGEPREFTLQCLALNSTLSEEQRQAISTPFYLKEPGIKDSLLVRFLSTSGDSGNTPIFGERVPSNTHNEFIYNNLIADLKSLASLYGKFDWDEGSVDAITAWNDSGLAPVPQQPKLLHYNSRRLAHLIKLCIIAAASRGNGKQIWLEDYQTALDWLLQAEATMPDIFLNSGIGGDSKAIDDAWFFVYSTYSKTKSPIFETRLYEFLRQRVPRIMWRGWWR